MAEKPIQQKNREHYSIVVLGRMNPSIHHPFWYESNGLISKAEREEILESGTVVTVPPYAHFVLSGMEITCLEGRWSIVTRDASTRERILDLAANSFKLLDHTPVGAFGINVDCIRQASVPSVPEFLSSRITRMQFGLSGDGKSSGTVSMAWSTLGRKVTVVVAPVADASTFVEVRTNTHYDMTEELYGNHFDLGAIIRRHFTDDVESAMRQTEQVVTAIQSGVEHGH